VKAGSTTRKGTQGLTPEMLTRSGQLRERFEIGDGDCLLEQFGQARGEVAGVKPGRRARLLLSAGRCRCRTAWAPSNLMQGKLYTPAGTIGVPSPWAIPGRSCRRAVRCGIGGEKWSRLRSGSRCRAAGRRRRSRAAGQREVATLYELGKPAPALTPGTVTKRETRARFSCFRGNRVLRNMPPVARVVAVI